MAVVFLLSGCGEGKTPSADPAVLENTIVQYNRLLAEGYRTLNMNSLAQVATEERATKAYYHMAALGEERKRMEATLKHMDFLGTKVLSPDQVEIKTREEWDYRHINIDSKKLESESSIIYELTYSLVKKNDKWLVSDIHIEKEENPQKGESLNAGSHESRH